MAEQHVLQWEWSASPTIRAEQAGCLARAFLEETLPDEERDGARLVLTGLLEDPSALVRRVLAEHFANSDKVPHYMVHILAEDQNDIAEIVLSRSPILSDAELIDSAATSKMFGQKAIALRPHVSAAVAAALAEVGMVEALISLVQNPGAELLDSSLHRMIERHGHHAELRQALFARHHLSPSVRSALMGAAAKALAALLTANDELTKEKAEILARDQRDRANLRLAMEICEEPRVARAFVAYLRKSGQLTAGLLLRGLFCGHKLLLERAFCELTGLPNARVASYMATAGSAGFATLYRNAKMPEMLLPVFVAALQALTDLRLANAVDMQLQTPVIHKVLDACQLDNPNHQLAVSAGLRRLEAEAACEEARLFQTLLPTWEQDNQAIQNPRPFLPPAQGEAQSSSACETSPATSRVGSVEIAIDFDALAAAIAAA
ncbi:MAG TPA: DUF2336 domain-containing protein [Methylocella sp.]|nr:DUF2336 domain-containing protein [Methylocella sp.]